MTKRPARAHLRDLLAEFENVELVGEASTAVEAEALLRAVEHDVVFLDIRMPGMDGMEAAALFAELPKPPFVVFTTAYEEYAAQGIRSGCGRLRAQAHQPHAARRKPSVARGSGSSSPSRTKRLAGGRGTPAPWSTSRPGTATG